MDAPVPAADNPTRPFAASFSFAVLTPAGRGAIATIAARGQGALEAIGRSFSPASGRELATYAASDAVYGRFRSSNAATEEIVVGILAIDEIEINCHGGHAAVKAICETLAREGGIEHPPRDWTFQSAHDCLAADALLALSEARTERVTRVLLDQYRGALRRELLEIDSLLVAGKLTAASQKIGLLLGSAELGLHLTQPWKVVFTGRPNVGKSSLMNAVLGYERSIVWHQPGTTRDVLTATTAIDGWWIELSDVAGLRLSHDAIEAAGVTRAHQAIAAADLVIFVVDTTVGWNAETAELYEEITKRVRAAGQPRNAIIVHNKCDLAGRSAPYRPEAIETSAITGEGLAELCHAIARSLVTHVPPPDAPVLFTHHQTERLQKASVALHRGEIHSARNYMSEINKIQGPESRTPKP